MSAVNGVNDRKRRSWANEGDFVYFVFFYGVRFHSHPLSSFLFTSGTVSALLHLPFHYFIFAFLFVHFSFTFYILISWKFLLLFIPLFNVLDLGFFFHIHFCQGDSTNSVGGARVWFFLKQ